MLANFVQQQTTTAGTGTIELVEVTGRKTFVEAFGSGARVRYAIVNADGTQREIGYGTVTDAGPDTLTREDIVESTNNGALVNFGAGAKNVYVAGGDVELIKFGVPLPPTAGGTADARTVIHAPPLTALFDGMRVRFRNGAAANATTTPTLKIDDLPATAWRLRDGSQPAAGDYAASVPMEVEYHEASDQWRLTFDLKSQMLAVISPSSLSASQNDWNPTGLSGAGTIRITSSNDIHLTGLAAIGDSRTMWLVNANAVGGKTITLDDESASSSAANRFALPGDYVLSPEEAVQIQYDATTQRWRAAGDVGDDPWTQIASAATCSIGLVNSRNVEFTGSTGITSLGPAPAGRIRNCRAAGVIPITHNGTSLICKSGASITTAVGDTMQFISLGSTNWEMIGYQRANGQALVASSGALKLISVQAASSSSSIDFTTGIDSTYDEYQVHFDAVVPATNAVELYARVSTNAGSTWESSSYRSGGARMVAGATLTLDGTRTDGIQMCSVAAGNPLDNTAANGGASGIIRFWVNNANGKKNFVIDTVYWNTSGYVRYIGAGQWNGANTVLNGIRFLLSSGNIASGNFRLYGVQKS